MEESQGRPWKWHRLVHVCRKWRRAIFRSPRRLGLQILCEYGAPIGSILASWPTLPLVAKFKADRKSKHIPRNVMVALRRPDRLCEIDLHVTSSMLAPIVEVAQKPCHALESIRITVETPTGPSMLVRNAFLGGSAPHLREIKLDGIAFPFPEIRQVLLSASNLVDLYLSHIPNDAYFSPSDLVTGLSTSLQLKRLTVDFHSLPSSSSPSPSMTHLPSQRTTLPSLTFLSFHGASGYLDEFVAQVELPALCKFAIRLFNDIFFEIPQFCQLIPRLNALKSPAQTIVKHNVDFVGVYFEEGNLLSEETEDCFLGTSCRQLDWQLSFVNQILTQLSFLLSTVDSLDIQSGDDLPTGEEDVESAQWLELFQLFAHVTRVYVWDQLVPSIVQALAAEDMTAEVLPELTSLYLSGYRSFPSVAKVVKQFVATRRLSGRSVSLTPSSEVRRCSPSHTILLSSGGDGNDGNSGCGGDGGGSCSNWNHRNNPPEVAFASPSYFAVTYPCGAGNNWRRTTVTIEVFHDDVLLEIFDFYRLYAIKQSRGSWKWLRLAHVCRKWRRIIFRSQHRLGLRILCEDGAPIESALAFWPNLPLVAKFHSGEKSKNIPGNVMVALHHLDRLCEIDLHVTSSLLAQIVEVTHEPCQALESICITVETHRGPSILVRNAFLGGSAPHLRKIKMEGVPLPFPEIRQILLSTNNLVELHLSKIPNDACFSPNDLVTGLSNSLQLKRLTVDFHSPASSPPSMTCPPSRRTTLPSLIFLEFHCESEYLEEFVAQMEFPSLSNFAIMLSNDIFFEIPRFYKIIPRLNVLGSHAWAIVTHTVDSVSVLLSREVKLERWSVSELEDCFLEASCRRLDWQLSFITQITSQLSPLLSSVHSLSIRGGPGFPTGQEDVDPTRWLEFFQPFTHVNHLYVMADRLVPCIMLALVADMTAEVLPELAFLSLSGFNDLRSTSPSVADAATEFVARRKLSGRNVTLSTS